MEGNTNQQQQQQSSPSSDTPYPTMDMLPAFRIRGCRPTGHHGVIRLKRHEYDELLTRQPSAALSYIDESDGEVILVGSSLELDQRLHEPVEHAYHRRSKTIVDQDPDLANRSLHIFDINKEQDVVDTWRQLDIRTLIEGEKAKQLFFGRINQQPPQPPAKDTAPAVRFGQVTPPRSSLKPSSSFNLENTHTTRWASYSSLPGSFDKDPIPVATADDTYPKDASNPDASKLKSKSTNDLRLDSRSSQQSELPQPAPSIPVRSSTLQVPATQKQHTEHQPLVDMFYSDQNESNTATAPATSESTQQQQPREWRPLLELFEDQLAELTAPSNKSNDNTPASPKAPFAQKSGEIFTQSIQSLLNGISALAIAFKKTNSELQQQIALAQQDLPNNVDKALRASAAAIDSLRSMIPPTKPEVQSEDLPAAATTTTADAPEAAPAANTSDPLPQSDNSDALMKAKTLSNRYKIQRHLLQPRLNQTDSDLQQISDLFELLELQTVMDSITAEVLLHSKIHKVLKRVSRSSKVPGDQKYNFKQRASDIAQAWMAILEKHRKAVQNSKTAAAVAAVLAAEQATTSTKLVQTAQGNKLETSGTSAQDDIDAERVEQITELMRQDLLSLGLLPPPQRSSSKFYTRADVLEAYMSKFRELKDAVDKQSSKPTVSHASTSMQVEQRSTNKMGGVIKDDSPFDDESPFELSNSKPIDSSHIPRMGHGILKPEAVNAPVSGPTSYPYPLPPRESLNPLDNDFKEKQKDHSRLQRVATLPPRSSPWTRNAASSYAPPMPPAMWPFPSEATTNNKDKYDKLRHRKSWHLGHAGHPPPIANSEQEALDISPAAAMHRYPPVSQIKWQRPTSFAPGMASKPTEPSLKASSMQHLPLPAMEPKTIYQPSTKIVTGVPSTWRPVYQPPIQMDKTKNTYLSRPVSGVPGDQDSKAKQNMQKCIDQLVEMGFIRGKAEAVAHATLGDLEMALDVLNEDSAAWKEKAKAEDAKATSTTRLHDEVPGSWGSWDDELYG